MPALTSLLGFPGGPGLNRNLEDLVPSAPLADCLGHFGYEQLNCQHGCWKDVLAECHVAGGSASAGLAAPVTTVLLPLPPVVCWCNSVNSIMVACRCSGEGKPMEDLLGVTGESGAPL